MLITYRQTLSDVRDSLIDRTLELDNHSRRTQSDVMQAEQDSTLRGLEAR